MLGPHFRSFPKIVHLLFTRIASGALAVFFVSAAPAILNFVLSKDNPIGQ